MKEKTKAALFELMELILELNHVELFQIGFSISGYQQYDVLPTFELRVYTAKTFPKAEDFIYERIPINDTTIDSIHAAKQWLIQKHKELVKEAA